MTVVTQPLPPVPPLKRRLWNVVRLHVANPWPTLVMPWIVFAAVFGLTLAIWYVVAEAAGGAQNLDADAFVNNGGVTWVLFFLTGIAAQAMSPMFRFALGLGMTRRDYYFGTVAYLAILASMYAAGVAVLAQVERLTNGWGLGGRFFAPWFLAGRPAWELWYIDAVAGLLLAMLGVATGAVWVRWKATGFYLLIGGLGLLMTAVVWLLTATESWGDIGGYLGSHSAVVVATWTLPVTVLCCLCGYLVLRRATTRT